MSQEWSPEIALLSEAADSFHLQFDDAQKTQWEDTARTLRVLNQAAWLTADVFEGVGKYYSRLSLMAVNRIEYLEPGLVAYARRLDADPALWVPAFESLHAIGECIRIQRTVEKAENLADSAIMHGEIVGGLLRPDFSVDADPDSLQEFNAWLRASYGHAYIFTMKRYLFPFARAGLIMPRLANRRNNNMLLHKMKEVPLDEPGTAGRQLSMDLALLLSRPVEIE